MAWAIQNKARLLTFGFDNESVEKGERTCDCRFAMRGEDNNCCNVCVICSSKRTKGSRSFCVLRRFVFPLRNELSVVILLAEDEVLLRRSRGPEEESLDVRTDELGVCEGTRGLVRTGVEGVGRLLSALAVWVAGCDNLGRFANVGIRLTNLLENVDLGVFSLLCGEIGRVLVPVRLSRLNTSSLASAGAVLPFLTGEVG